MVKGSAAKASPFGPTTAAVGPVRIMHLTDMNPKNILVSLDEMGLPKGSVSTIARGNPAIWRRTKKCSFNPWTLPHQATVFSPAFQ